MRCSKMAMRRKIEMKMAVAANPKEMASMDVPKSLSVDASPPLASAAAAGSDGVCAASPGHGLDLCQDSLISACFLAPFGNLNNHCKDMALVSKFTEEFTAVQARKLENSAKRNSRTTSIPYCSDQPRKPENNAKRRTNNRRD
jgi:hypothetical protein